jgi:predicted TIM-barrel enzyme
MRPQSRRHAPYGDANAIVVEMAREVIPLVGDQVPVLAGVCGTDPFRVLKLFLRELQAIGFSGVQNFPTVGLIDGGFRQGLEETGMGFGLEVDMIRTASELGLLTCPTYRRGGGDGEGGGGCADSHMGLTTKGTIVRGRRDFAGGGSAIHARRGEAVRSDILVLCHGVRSRSGGLCAS